jgi:hypothetical protein
MNSGDHADYTDDQFYLFLIEGLKSHAMGDLGDALNMYSEALSIFVDCVEYEGSMVDEKDISQNSYNLYSLFQNVYLGMISRKYKMSHESFCSLVNNGSDHECVGEFREKMSLIDEALNLEPRPERVYYKANGKIIVNFPAYARTYMNTIEMLFENPDSEHEAFEMCSSFLGVMDTMYTILKQNEMETEEYDKVELNEFPLESDDDGIQTNALLDYDAGEGFIAHLEFFRIVTEFCDIEVVYSPENIGDAGKTYDLEDIQYPEHTFLPPNYTLSDLDDLACEVKSFIQGIYMSKLIRNVKREYGRIIDPVRFLEIFPDDDFSVDYLSGMEEVDDILGYPEADKFEFAVIDIDGKH